MVEHVIDKVGDGSLRLDRRWIGAGTLGRRALVPKASAASATFSLFLAVVRGHDSNCDQSNRRDSPSDVVIDGVQSMIR